jgi:NAD(P)-dependent dehydrogenase (short-subunit alcohol dehydrogenase family)
VRRVCLLTGAGGRLGNVFCRTYAKRYNIVAVYRNRPPDCVVQGQRQFDPLDLQRETNNDDTTVFAVRGDLTDGRDLDRIVELSLARFGTIDLLVNAAAHSRWGSLVEADQLLQEATLQIEVNTLAPVRLAVIVARGVWRDRDHENRRNNRNVVNVSSTAGHIAYPGSGQSIYAASKAALNMLTKHMADEFATFGVRVNAVAPNSFPAIVPTVAVARTIGALDQSDETGVVRILDGHSADAATN